MQARPNNVVMTVKADDETGLACMKSIAAHRLTEFAQGERPRFAWTGSEMAWA